MNDLLYLEGVAEGDHITVYTRNDQGETIRAPYPATFIRTEGDTVVVIRDEGKERKITLYDTLNFDREKLDGELFVVEEL